MALDARTQALAHRLVHDVAQRLAPGCLPVFSSDGLALYFYALTAHFGSWIQAANERRRTWCVDPRPPLASTPGHQTLHLTHRRPARKACWARVCGPPPPHHERPSPGSARTIRDLSPGLDHRRLLRPGPPARWRAPASQGGQTAFIERLNLTVRRSLASTCPPKWGMARRSWSTALSTEDLALQFDWWRAASRITSSSPTKACARKSKHPTVGFDTDRELPLKPRV